MSVRARRRRDWFARGFGNRVVVRVERPRRRLPRRLSRGLAWTPPSRGGPASRWGERRGRREYPPGGVRGRGRVGGGWWGPRPRPRTRRAWRRPSPRPGGRVIVTSGSDLRRPTATRYVVAAAMSSGRDGRRDEDDAGVARWKKSSGGSPSVPDPDLGAPRSLSRVEGTRRATAADQSAAAPAGERALRAVQRLRECLISAPRLNDWGNQES